MTRHPDDYYRTPDWCAAVGAHIALQHGTTVLDPCAGDGSLMQAVRRAGGDPLGIEIDEHRAAIAGATNADALSTPWQRASVVLMNPPFKLWQPFVERALTGPLSLDPSAVVVLLRMGALAGQRRRDWWRAVGDRWGVTLHVLSKRPSFTGNGTDRTDYAWVELSSDRAHGGVEWV
jgi:hypothetical protein